MSQQLLTLTPNDSGLGDTLAAGAAKINAMFAELYSGAVVNVMAAPFNATGNGSTDDYSAIANAAAAAAGKILYFPKPSVRYAISNFIALPDFCRVMGESWPEIYQSSANQTHFVPGNDNEIAFLRFSGTGSTYAGVFGRGAVFLDPNNTGTLSKNCYIHHNKFDNTISLSAISGNNFDDARIEHNHIVLDADAEHGIYSSGGSGERTWIRNNHLEKTVSNGNACNAINIKGNNKLWISQNSIKGVGWDGYGVLLSGVSSVSVKIDKNQFSSLNSNAVAIMTGNVSTDTDIMIEDNEIDGGFYGIQIKSAKTTVFNNRIKNTQFRGIETDGASGGTKVTIEDNKIFDCVGGIRVVTAGSDTHVWNNTIVGSSGVGIEYASGSTVGSVKGNVVRGHSTGMTLSVAVPNYNNDILGVAYDEQGTWTPNVGGSATYSVQTGNYTKKGKEITIWGTMTITTLGTGSTTTLSGLPYTSNASLCTGTMSYFTGLAHAVVFLSIYVVGSTATLNFAELTGAATGTTPTAAIFASGTHVNFMATYFTP